MKKFSRCLAIVPLVAAAIGFQSVSATAAETMADQYQPRIDGDGVVRDSQPDTIDFDVLDYPEGTHFTIQASDGHSEYVGEEGCYAYVYDRSYGLSVLTQTVDGGDKNYEGWTIPGNRYIYPSVLVDYPDGSFEYVNFKMLCSVLDTYTFQPKYEDLTLEPGQSATLNAGSGLPGYDFPEGTTRRLLLTSDMKSALEAKGWKVSFNENTGAISVTAPTKKADSIELPVRYTYPDKTGDDVKVNVSSSLQPIQPNPEVPTSTVTSTLATVTVTTTPTVTKTAEPSTITEGPGTVTKHPAPITKTAEPSTITEEPSTVTEQPAPITKTAEPSTITEEPSTVTEQPAPITVTASPETTTVTAGPVTVTTQPTVTKSQTPNNNGSDDASSTGSIIGIVMGVIGTILGILGLGSFAASNMGIKLPF